jgi:hypothetical protein
MSPVNNEEGFVFLQLLQQHTCMKLIEKYERDDFNGTKFSRVVISRLDMFFLLSMPFLDTQNAPGCWIPCAGNDFNGVCDHFAVCDRKSAETYLNRLLVMQDEHFPSEHTDWMNAEVFLDRALKRDGVQIFRFHAAMFRSCAIPTEACKQVPELGLYCKHSGTECDMAVSTWQAHNAHWVD